MLLTCICCKTLEHVFISNTNKCLALDNILADCQHGFRSLGCCETQLVQFVYDTINNMDGAVYSMDFAACLNQGTTLEAIDTNSITMG